MTTLRCLDLPDTTSLTWKRIHRVNCDGKFGAFDHDPSLYALGT